MKHSLGLALSVLLATSAIAQTDTGSTSKTHQKSGSRPLSTEINELKDAIAAQQEQIKQLQQQIQSRDQAIQSLQSQISNLPKPPAPPPPGPDYGPDVNALQHEEADLKAGEANMAETLTETQKRIGDLESPLAIHYKGVTLTPGGFMAAETVWRQRSTFGDINTPFNNLPFAAASQAHLTEFYGSGRQSRISMLMQGKGGWGTYAGYYEMDFLSAGTTSNNNQSNSYTLRQRQAFAQAALNSGWTFTGGQMWSLVMETRKGLDNRTEATPLQIDAQYVAGMSWARQYGFRVTKNFHNRAYFGFSVENSQETVGGSGFNSNYIIGGPGAGAGLYNPLANYSANLSPDFILKAAFEPGFGGHYEVFGVGSLFRNRIYPCAIIPPGNPNGCPGTPAAASASGAFNDTNWGGGIGANARYLFDQKKIETAIHFLGGNGMGRYGDTGLPDITVNPHGFIKPLRSYQALASLEYHLPKWDFYFYGGGEYVGRRWFQSTYNTAGTLTNSGYGSPLFNNSGCGTEAIPTVTVAGASSFNNGFPLTFANGQPAIPGGTGSCSGQTRAIIEGTAGFWYKPYNGPKGRLQMGIQYSYATRDTWVAYGTAAPGHTYPSGTIQPEGIDNMFFTSFRYYLP